MNSEIKPGQTWISKFNKESIITRSVDPMTMHACCGFQADPVFAVDLCKSTGITQTFMTTSYIKEYYYLK